jgi:hypothetical protein
MLIDEISNYKYNSWWNKWRILKVLMNLLPTIVSSKKFESLLCTTLFTLDREKLNWNFSYGR